MNPVIITLVLTSFAAAPLLFRKFRAPHSVFHTPAEFANVGEGDFAHGHKPYLVDIGAVAGRYLLYKIGSDNDHVTTCGAGDSPIGQSDDQGDSNNTDVPVSINLFGACRGTLRVVTDGTIANGNYVKAAANGQVTVAAAGDIICGRACFGTDTTTNAGDVITIVPMAAAKYQF